MLTKSVTKWNTSVPFLSLLSVRGKGVDANEFHDEVEYFRFLIVTPFCERGRG